MKGLIIYSTYTIIEDKTVVQLFGRLENGESFVTQHTFSPRFFITSKNKSKVEKELKKFKSAPTDYKNFKSEPVLKVSHKNHRELNKLEKAIHKKVDTYEADLKPTQQFLISKDIYTEIEIQDNEHYESSEKVNRIYNNPKIEPTKETNIKPKIISLDIESEKDTNNLICIGLTSENYKKNFMLTSHKIPNTIPCESEYELLEKFKQEIIDQDPDIITGWNVIDFDFAFLKEKFQEHKIPFDLGRTNDSLRLRIQNGFFRSSSIDIPGRQVLDAMSFIKDPFLKEAPTIKKAKFESWSLENVSNELLGKGKLLKGDRHNQLEDLYKKNTQKTHKEIVDYNILDCDLVLEILEKTKLIDLAMERLELTGMSLDKITASIAAFDSLYIREAHKKSLVSPTNKYEKKESQITGGFVKSPEPGIYHNVLILDFKSLYPSILRTFNIDPSSRLEKPTKTSLTTINKVHYENIDGILPIIIEKLHKAREKAKSENRELASYAIKTIMNSFWGVLASPNSRFFNFDMANSITTTAQHIIKLTAKKIEELGYKVTYGDSVTGDTEITVNEKGNVKFMKIKDLFKKINKKILNKEYDFPKNLKVLTLDKECKSTFKKIKYVVRHKTQKKIYRVWFTNTEYIDVTEDHSLIGYLNALKKPKVDNINERLLEVKPSEIGNKVKSIINLKKIPLPKTKSKKYPKELYELMGYFIGDGSFKRNNNHKKYNKDYYISISTGLDDKEIIKKLIKPLIKKEWIKNYWISKTRKGDITLYGLDLIKLIAKECRNKDNKKIIPPWLFEEEEENIASFLRGLFSADGTAIMRQNKPIIRLTTIKEDYMKITKKLLYRLGISNSTFKENKPNKYKGKKLNSFSKHVMIKDILLFKEKVGFLIKRKQARLNKIKNHKTKKNFYNFDFDLSKVKKIEKIKNSGLVYDIEVADTHRFFANEFLVHNTDSVFVATDLGKEKANALGLKIQDNINEFYKKYIKKDFNRKSFLELEFEKQYLSMMIPKVRGKETAAKKRYAGLLEKNGKEVIEIIGLEAIRGDWTEAAQDFQRELLDKIFHKEDPKTFIKNYIKKVLDGKLDSKLVYRKSIRKKLTDYVKTTPPHVKAARKLKTLNSNIIEYYITTEGPEPIQQLEHKLDYKHYIDKQIKPIANQTLALFDQNLDDLLAGSKQATLF